MKLIRYKNKIIKAVQGHLPTSVFIWYVILSLTLLLFVVNVLFGYYSLYNSTQDVNSIEVSSIQYKNTINKSDLQKVLDVYEL